MFSWEYCSGRQLFDSVAVLIGRINDKEGIPVHSQRLLYAGKLLYDGSKTLKECKIEKGSMIDIVMNILGGSPKR